MNKLIITLLCLIVLFSFGLRFYKVSEVPPSLNWDEASIGYNAYSILKTGKDEWGKLLPLHFRSYGEYKLPVQVYASIPGIAIFGLNEFGVRITPVVYGALTVLILFFLVRELFKSYWIGLFSSLLLAISPWHIQLTRGSFESAFACFWVVLGIWFLVKGFKDPKWWIVAMIPLALSVYTYNTARVFTPVFLLLVAVIYHKDIQKQIRHFLISLTIFTILMIPLLFFLLSGEGNSRYKLVSVTDDPGLVLRINEQRGLSNLPGPLPRLVHNKVSYVAKAVIGNYLAHFTPDFLFISGAPHKQHHVQKIGQLYLYQAPFLLLGLLYLFKARHKFRWLLVTWPLLTFFPVAFTNDSIPNALRSLIAAPFYQIITGVGLYNAFVWIRKRSCPAFYISAFVMATVAITTFILYFRNYLFIYPLEYSRDWQYGNKQAVETIKQNYDKYDLIVFSRHYGEPHMFTLFFTTYDPARFFNDPRLTRFETYDWVRVVKFDKFYFPDLGDKGTKFDDIVSKNPGKRILFIGIPGDFPSSITPIKKVDFLNGNHAFEIIEVM
ncbi:glycosyltransferase family 39 protein [Candidatus Daviesbacteria bacterium]|nr:glycosyltransferase family 39 protein [Candidatus Daviesbacteria bacterium]